MSAPLLLVHAPLLGPVSWELCAEVLRAAGHEVAVPDLRGAVVDARRWWQRAADLCAAAAGPRPVVAGHSGAGVLLPLVAAAVSAAAVIFVDAVVPAEHGETVAGAAIREFVEQFAHDEPLPPWSSWWPAGVMAELLPDVAVREALQAEAPRLPRDFYEEPVPVPAGWGPPAVTYVQLSPAYDDAAAQARRRGWRVIHLLGRHLDTMADPARIAAVLSDVARAGPAVQR